jgi:hypothetical protein
MLMGSEINYLLRLYTAYESKNLIFCSPKCMVFEDENIVINKSMFNVGETFFRLNVCSPKESK